MHTLQTLRVLGLDPRSGSARRAVALVAENGRWEHAGQRYFDGEVEPCINGRTIETGAYFGVDVAGVLDRVLAERLADGGWNCEAENGGGGNGRSVQAAGGRLVAARPDPSGARAL